ncbi:hypothetical protein [Actinomyces vulturis]|uniref:hypothetical protein n=1 Tax=Actinomyces vulturis TaxID=1857645 RepID=UPI0008310780|nr:hypothetical protein [Actinomyces vulturis]
MSREKDTCVKASSAPSWHYPASLIGVGVVTFILCGLIGGWVTVATSSDPMHHPSVWGAAAIIVIAAVGWNTGLRIRERHRFGMPLWARLNDEQAHTLAQYRLWARTGKLSEPDAAEMALASKVPGTAMVGRRRHSVDEQDSDSKMIGGSRSPHTPLSAKDRRRMAEIQHQKEAMKFRQQDRDS